MAVELGFADAASLTTTSAGELPFKIGVEQFLEHRGRPRVLGGTTPGTVKRYRAVFDKAVPYFAQRRLTTWNQVKRRQLENYAAWLDGEGYAYRTEFFEITAIKTAFNWWISEALLPESAKINLPMHKPEDTDTYCYRPEEVEAMLRFCSDDNRLAWLADVILALAYTGMRISELANLTWSNVDLAEEMITLRDESRSRRARRCNAQTTKSRRDRFFPIHPDLFNVLNRLHTKKDRARVFPAPRGGVLQPDNVRSVLIKQVIEPLAEQFSSPEDEVGFKDGRLHSLRHFFCSYCAHNSVAEQVVMRWLGHRDSKMVRRYYHLHDEEARKQMRKLKSLGNFGAT